MSTPKEKLQEMIQKLDDPIATEVLDFAVYIVERKKKELEESLNNALIDKEPLTDEEKKAIEEAKEDIKAGRVYSLDEIKKDLGL